METQISEILQTLETISGELVEDRKEVNTLRNEMNDLKMMVKQLTERFPINMDRKIAYAAKEGVIDGFREIVNPKPEKGLNRIKQSIKRLLKGVKT